MRREPMEPDRQLPDLERWEGQWIAVKDDMVVAAAPSSGELVPEVRALGEAGRGAVARYVPRRSEVVPIGVG